MAAMYDVVIIGSGISGLAAAMYAGRFRLKTLIIGDKPGGTIILTDEVANYPGFKKITGMELAERIKEHALDYDVKIINEKATSIKFSKKVYEVHTSKKKYSSKTVIYAAGTEWRKLGVEGEEKLANKGVHYCALCDGPLYKNKTIGVVGGSDSAAKEALLLTQWARKVYIIYRREKIRAEPINHERVKKNKKITIIKNTNVKKIIGEQKLTHVILDKEHNGSKKLKLDALFIEIGHEPLSGLAKNIGVELNNRKEIKTNRAAETNLPGFYASGDVADTRFKQGITAVAEGVIAAHSAYEYLKEAKK